MKKTLLLTAAVAMALAGATGAQAAKGGNGNGGGNGGGTPTPSPTPTLTACANSDITPGALACSGFYDGNVLNDKKENLLIQKDALASLGYTFDTSTFTSLEKIEGLKNSQDVDFTTLLQGNTFVAFHFGNGNGGPGEATAFYRLDAGAGLDVIRLAYKASSNAVLYKTSPSVTPPPPVNTVPEPATWALMLGGFGLVGASLRRRSRNTVAA